MAEKHLGPEFEIHGGGLDLRFPHHENELAQSRSRGYPFARIWLHNGMLELGDEKMSKSLGNVVTLRNVLDTWGREVLLLYHLSGHWRKPVDFTDEALESARTQLAGFREALAMPARAAGDWGASRKRSRTTSTRLPCWHCCTAGPRAARARSSRAASTSSASARRSRCLRSSSSCARDGRTRGRRRTGRTADAARDEIEAAGWAVTDHPGGTAIWPRP